MSKRPIRVLVCGGRHYSNKQYLYAKLSQLHAIREFALVIQGGATGADRLAASWAKENGVPVLEFPAKWKELGKAAGPIRNREMLRDGKPEVVIAFAGGVGTEDMVKAATLAGLKVLRGCA